MAARALKILVRLRALHSDKFNGKPVKGEDLDRISIIWGKELSDISDNDINRALSECSSKFSWAPNISEFKNLCLSYKPSNLIPWSKSNDSLQVEKDNLQRIINEGAKICKQLKEIYPDKSWWQIADIFKIFKLNTRKFYPNLNNLDFLLELVKYKKENIMEALCLEKQIIT